MKHVAVVISCVEIDNVRRGVFKFEMASFLSSVLTAVPYHFFFALVL